ncbi:MAG: histidine triad nucleotide-binding protein [Simkania sp.]|nr:histidine triad nucleotide-binding protein [Simkania sp.]MCB1074183.1 histidine triad nucleotide-binding protein [Simkania sp.]MCP5490813.1 histidine triad nucleotide-binding protein [Chlamydiales bacterium]
MSKTIFGKIISGDLPSIKLYESDNVLAIKDVSPKAPVHILIMPKKEYKNLQDVPVADLPVIAEIVEVAQKLARELGVEDNYRFLTNNGTRAGQSVFHLHFHLIGGKELGPMA